MRMPVAPENSNNKYLSFQLEGEHYLIEVEYVREVISGLSLNPIPGGHALAEGMVKIRGDLMTVLSGRKLLGGNTPPPEAIGHILVLNLTTGQYGITVDQVDQIREIESSAIERRAHTQENFIIGTVQIDGTLHIIIDLSRLHFELD